MAVWMQSYLSFYTWIYIEIVGSYTYFKNCTLLYVSISKMREKWENRKIEK